MALAAERVAVGAANVSWVDRFYRRVVRNIFFADGFGDLTKLDGVLELKRNAATLARRPLRVLSMKRVDGDSDRKDGVTCWEGRFVSPVEEVAPGLLPPECRTVGFQFIEPRARGNRAVVHLPATGDHSYWRRRLLVAMPLARERNVASVIPENPLYGARKPTNQLRSNLRCVMDLYLMGVAIQFESVALLHWLEEQGYDHLGINGLSMGGHMASMVAATWPKALAHVSCLGPFTASGVFTRGVFAECCAWDALAREAGRWARGDEKNVADVLRHVMDRATALHLFGSPVTTAASVVFAARHDAYVPLDDMIAYDRFWPGVEMRWINSGHLGSFLFQNGSFVKGVVDALDKLDEYKRAHPAVRAAA